MVQCTNTPVLQCLPLYARHANITVSRSCRTMYVCLHSKELWTFSPVKDYINMKLVRK